MSYSNDAVVPAASTIVEWRWVIDHDGEGYSYVGVEVLSEALPYIQCHREIEDRMVEGIEATAPPEVAHLLHPPVWVDNWLVFWD